MPEVRTDLHTHFAGVLSPDELVQLGLAHGVQLDAHTAIKLGIVSQTFSEASIPLKDLAEDQISLLKRGLAMDPTKQSLFNELDDVYANRSFITKNPDMFIPQLDAIAQGYAKQGVQYAELSYAGIISNPDLLRQMHEAAPGIEESTGVKLRFLAALWRHSDHEWNMDEADRMKKVMQSPYVVGLDVMGHEKNPIRDIKEPLQAITRHAAMTTPGFTIRVHSGENPYYSAAPDMIDEWNFNNTHEAVQIIHEASLKPENGGAAGPYASDIQVRVGHGRYGLHPDTLKLMGRVGCVGELCLTSNELLNHADNYHAPFELYQEHGVPFVISSDGYGMYHTTLPEELKKALDAGMNSDAEALRRNTEADIVALDQRRFRDKSATWEVHVQHLLERNIDPFDDMRNAEYSTPKGNPRWNNAVAEIKKQTIAMRRDGLLMDLNAKGINTNNAEIERMLAERQPILFSGASKSSWKNVPTEQQVQVEATLKEFIGTIDNSEHVVVTGGTDYGFESVVHRLIEERNATLPPEKRVPVIGAITLEAQSSEIKPEKISHAMVLKYGDGYAHSWMDQPPSLLDMIQRNNGRVIMGGGGQVIRDMIVDAEGRGLISNGQIALFDNVVGASSDKAAIYPEAAVSTAQDLHNLRFFKPIDPEIYFDHSVSDIAEKTVTIQARPAIPGEEIVTIMKDGLTETKNTANNGDYVVKNPDGEEYIVPGNKFEKKYVKTDQPSVFKPSGGPVEVMPLTEDVKFKAPWGEEMRIKAGGVLVYNGPGDIYGIQPDEFKSTYAYSKDIQPTKPQKNLDGEATPILDYGDKGNITAAPQQQQRSRQHPAEAPKDASKIRLGAEAEAQPRIHTDVIIDTHKAQLAKEPPSNRLTEHGPQNPHIDTHIRGVGVAMGVFGLASKLDHNEDFQNDQTKKTAYVGIAADTGAIVADTAEMASGIRKLAKISASLSDASKVTRIAAPVSMALSVASGFIEVELGRKTGDGHRAAAAVGSTAGAIVGGGVGAKGGAAIGGAIGAFFFGAGAVPGAAIGGALGAIGGAIAGAWGGGKAADELAGDATQRLYDDRLKPALASLNANKSWGKILDQNNDGTIDKEELRKKLNSLGLTSVAALDKNHDGTVTGRELSDSLNEKAITSRKAVAFGTQAQRTSNLMPVRGEPHFPEALTAPSKEAGNPRKVFGKLAQNKNPIDTASLNQSGRAIGQDTTIFGSLKPKNRNGQNHE